METTGYERCHTEGRKNMRETKKEFQEERAWLLGDPHKVGTPRRMRKNIQVMVSEFRALHYSQLLGENSLPFWSNKQVISFLMLNTCSPCHIFLLHNNHTLL
jgi:hypothetical protein